MRCRPISRLQLQHNKNTTQKNPNDKNLSRQYHIRVDINAKSVPFLKMKLIIVSSMKHIELTLCASYVAIEICTAYCVDAQKNPTRNCLPVSHIHFWLSRMWKLWADSHNNVWKIPASTLGIPAIIIISKLGQCGDGTMGCMQGKLWAVFEHFTQVTTSIHS